MTSDAPTWPDAPGLRPLGRTGLMVSGVALGCWPIAGVTTLGANPQDSIATIRQAIDSGVNFFDTAHVYGAGGESELLIARALGTDRDRVVLATKGGVHFEGGCMVQDARPETLVAECDESLRRLRTDRVELLYLHSPDPAIPIEESAGALAALKQQGKAIAIGASNCSLEQVEAFSSVCPVDVVQLPYNMLQRGIEQHTIPWCQRRGVAIACYWPLMKGLLAGKLPADGALHPDDSRNKYPMFQGAQWQANQRFLAALRVVADGAGCSVAQLVVNWTMHRPGVTSVLCGAKRAWQIAETAVAMRLRLSNQQHAAIEAAIAERGPAPTTRNFA